MKQLSQDATNYQRQINRRVVKRKLYKSIIYVLCCAASLGIGIYSAAGPDFDGSVNEKIAEALVPEAGNYSRQQQGYSVDEPPSAEWNLMLVNPWNKIPPDYDVILTQLKNGHAIDERAYPYLQNMMDDCRAEGLSPLICSSYRSIDKQAALLGSKVNQYQGQGYAYEAAISEAAQWVAIPGTSEHQLGLAVDIVSLHNQRLDQSQERTDVQKWLINNCYNYGFILRYPADKSDITGVGYEPWHYRYVGKEAAAEIMEQGICLEEYLGVGGRQTV